MYDKSDPRSTLAGSPKPAAAWVHQSFFGSELALFYDHRRDHLAGGLVAGRAAGFFGSVGLAGEVALGGWTATAEVEVGSAWVTTVGVRRRLP